MEKISGLNNFSRIIKYNERISPCIGDTYRQSLCGKLLCQKDNALHNVSDAGYIVVNGTHLDLPYQLNFIGSSLCSTHKHQDNLSFTMFFDGIEWLIDPSFYSHEYEDEVPSYLRSSWAHNTISVPNKNYSIEPGKCKLEVINGGGNFHLHGCSNAIDEVVCIREIYGRPDKLHLFFKDRVISDTSLAVSRLHFNENVTLKKIDGFIVASHPSSLYKIIISSPSNTLEIITDNTYSIEPITGLGFMEAVSIPAIESTFHPNSTFFWEIKVQ
jgi:hypothetical protein